MPFKSRVEEEHDATIVISSGDESFEEFMDAIVSFYADRPTRNVIVDFFGKPPFRLTSEQVLGWPGSGNGRWIPLRGENGPGGRPGL